MAARRARGPLSRERVLAAALALADSEGLPAVTMRHLAADLGIEAMSLYYHLPGKEGLLDGLVEAVIDEINAAVAGADGDHGWRDRLRQRFLLARTVMLRHPWAPGLIGSRETVPVSVYVYYEGILATMVAGGFSYRIAHRALHAFGSLALGFAQEVFRPAAAGGDMNPDATEAEFATLAEELPHLAALARAESHDAADPMLGWCDSQVEFEFTLDLLLDGLERARRADVVSH